MRRAISARCCLASRRRRWRRTRRWLTFSSGSPSRRADARSDRSRLVAGAENLFVPIPGTTSCTGSKKISARRTSNSFPTISRRSRVRRRNHGQGRALSGTAYDDDWPVSGRIPARPLNDFGVVGRVPFTARGRLVCLTMGNSYQRSARRPIPSEIAQLGVAMLFHEPRQIVSPSLRDSFIVARQLARRPAWPNSAQRVVLRPNHFAQGRTWAPSP